jgi:cell wall-associated NlpC family hydrolase
VSASFDRRITAARPDLAAAHLKGIVAAERYAEGRSMQVAHGSTALRAAPSDAAPLETELLFGERLTVYEVKDGWAWGQAALDDQVGYGRVDSLAASDLPPTHRVVVRATPLLNEPDAKLPARAILPLNAKLPIAEHGARFSRLAGGGYVYSGHIAGIGSHIADWIAIAEGFLGVPYVWGGKTFAGIDCSGLIQTALETAGIAAPRDTDLMEAALGKPPALDAPLQRGDLVFWKGHMGAMLDAVRIIHASGSAMQVVIEDFASVRARILADGFPIRTIKRLERVR